MIKMESLDLSNQRVLLREDLNVPMQNGVITNDTRIKAIVPTLKELIQKNARIILISHLGRPKEGDYNPEFSLQPIAEYLSNLLNQPVRFEKEWLNGVSVAAKEVVLCENVRFNFGEKANDEKLSRQMAALCDVFIMDAFATAHRAEASTVGVAKYAPIAVAGPLLIGELNALDKILKNPQHPIVAIIAGSKISTKLPILKSLLPLVDTLIVGGGIANQFIALSHSIGASIYEANCIKDAKELYKEAVEKNVKIAIPVDGVVAKTLSDSAEKRISDFSDILIDEKILDIGPKTITQYTNLLKDAKTILWNGPVGAFEIDSFGMGTQKLAEAIAASQAYSVAGGGDTLAAIDKYAVADKISYISTGGGAFLEYLEGKVLPAVAILEERAIKIG
jgi:phosphoglycerate kinase